LADQLDGDIPAHEVSAGDHPFQSTFEFADVGADALGNEEGSVVGKVDTRLLGLLHQNGYPGLQLGRLDRHGQPPAKTGLEALFKAVDFLRITVTGEDDLLAAFK